MTFIPRLTKPEKGNPYYNTKANGGYSPCIKGKPTDHDCDALPNCVGYAVGRFNEIGNYGYCKYARSTNAENFIEACKAQGLTIGNTPKLGAIIVWMKGATLNGSDGAGHVAVVEQINANGSIVTSESGWNSSAFWTTKRTNSNGRWGAGNGYTFRGFIYNPAVTEGETIVPEEDEVDSTKLQEDGEWGMATTTRLQQIFGTVVDGIVSNQHASYRVSNPGLRRGWQWHVKPNGKGSILIKAMQKWAGMPADEQDGEIGPKTICAFQAKLGTFVDGKVSNPSQMVKALQKWANNQT